MGCSDADRVVRGSCRAIQVILFIYRDEYYDRNSQDKGLAEVIISKQRNVPAGVVKLAFHGQYARFDNATVGMSWEFE